MKFVLLCLLVFLSVSIGFAQSPIENYAIYDIEYEDVASVLPILDYDVWHDRIGVNKLSVRLSPDEYRLLSGDYPNLLLNNEQTSMLPTQAITGYSCYRTVEETETTFEQLEAAHPNLVERVDIGDSFDKAYNSVGLLGYDLWAYVLTNEATNSAEQKPALLILAAVHAREYATAELATRFAERLLANYGSDPDITWLLDYHEVHIIPQGNPDGRKLAETGVAWRKNTNGPLSCIFPTSYGVDLNRNGSYRWGGSGSSTNRCSDNYRGSAAGSEVETIAFETYAKALFPDQRADGLFAPAPPNTMGVFISLHSFGEEILVPWGWTNYTSTPNFEDLNLFGRRMAYYNDYVVYGTGPAYSPASGTHDDFVYGELGVASYTFEMGTSHFEPCESFESTVLPKNLDALMYAFKHARTPYTTSKAPTVSDIQLEADGVTATTNLVVEAGTQVRLAATVDDTQFDTNGWYVTNGIGAVASEPIVSAGFTIDQPTYKARGQVQLMSAVDGSFNEAAEEVEAFIDTTQMASGKHTIFVSAKDTGGIDGAESAIFLTVTEAQGVPTAISLNSTTSSTLPTLPMLLFVITLLGFGTVKFGRKQSA